MANTEFAAFLRQKKVREVPQEQVNWERRKTIWLKKIDAIFQDVETWLAPYKNPEDGSEPLLDYVIDTQEIYEERLGCYSVCTMKIHIGSEEVILAPKGLVIIGGLGRVDMSGPLGTVMAILNDTDQAPRFRVTLSTSFPGDVFPPFSPERAGPSIEEKMENSAWYFVRPEDRKTMLRVTEASFIEMLQNMVR